MAKTKEKKPLNQLIHEFRNSLGLSQRDFGRFIGAEGAPISQETISQWETGARSPLASKNLQRLFSRAKEKRFMLRPQDVFNMYPDDKSS